jgi:D-glycero-alpha-D-manno-heptose-7-phosphate kinase
LAESVKKILERHPVSASAPCRIDSGGTWDIKALALPMARIEPVTVNMALTLRTEVTLAPFAEGRVKVSSDGFSHEEDYPLEGMRFNSSFGLFFAAVAHFDLHGLQVHIRADSPVKAALGGSSTALVALIKALSKLTCCLGRPGLSRVQILHLGYHLEDAVSPGKCGIQDQAAAVFGGVHRWTWHFENRNHPFRRESLLDRSGQRELSEHILLAYSGKSHVSTSMNQIWIDDFLSGRTRAGWMKANDIVKRFAKAIREKAWKESARLLREEMVVRRHITPDALIPTTERLVNQAEEAGCGARFTGAGAGGSVWALGERQRIETLREVWQATLAPIKGAGVLECQVESAGVR